VNELDLDVGDDRQLHVYDTAPEAGADQLTVFWHHGTPNIGSPPAPLYPAAAELGIRFVAHDRPGYGGSTSRPGRAIGSVAADVARIADALHINRFAVLGHSGGGPHALACAALLPDRVVGAVSIAGLAPFDADGLDWFAGMTAAGEASLRAAAAGRTSKERHEAAAGEDDEMFIQADLDALRGEWGWLGSVVGPALAAGPGGLIDDDLAYVTPWGFDPAAIDAPVLLLHGRLDRIVPCAHSEWLVQRCATAALDVRADDGHLSVLAGAPAALAWLRKQ